MVSIRRNRDIGLGTTAERPRSHIAAAALAAAFAFSVFACSDCLAADALPGEGSTLNFDCDLHTSTCTCDGMFSQDCKALLISGLCAKPGSGASVICCDSPKGKCQCVYKGGRCPGTAVPNLTYTFDETGKLLEGPLPGLLESPGGELQVLPGNRIEPGEEGRFTIIPPDDTQPLSAKVSCNCTGSCGMGGSCGTCGIKITSTTVSCTSGNCLGSCSREIEILPNISQALPQAGLVSSSFATMQSSSKDSGLQPGTYTIQHKYNKRFADAYTSSGDYAVVTRPAQNNATQRWVVKSVGPELYTIQQEYNGRFVDAYGSSKQNYGLVTRPAQNNSTQRWIIRPVGDGSYTIQQQVNQRYADAYTSGSDYRLVTRTAQGNDTQRWIFKLVSYNARGDGSPVRSRGLDVQASQENADEKPEAGTLGEEP